MEKFLVSVNGVDDYIAYVRLDDVAEPMKSMLSQGAYINNGYARVGMYQKNFGTKLTAEEFAVYFNAFTGLLTQDEYKLVI